MDSNFWLKKWQDNEIRFHELKANPLLVKHFHNLALGPESRVFIPLCGKTLDAGWLLSQGHRVVGAELVEMAIQQLFEELRTKPIVTALGSLKRYSAPNIDVFVGDIFELTAQMLGPVDAVYDRAALVALPEEMRIRYAAHLSSITERAPQLLITLAYDQGLIPGPAFSVTAEEVHRHYKVVRLIESQELPKGIKGKFDCRQSTWRIF